MSWLLETFLGLNADATAAKLNQIRTNLNDFLRLHTHAGTAGDGAPLYLGSEYIQIVALYPSEDSGWNTKNSAEIRVGCYLSTDDSLVGHSVTYRVSMRGGTWRLDLLSRKTSGSGILTVTIDGVTVGTIDLYNGSTVSDQTSSLTGLVIPSLAANEAQELTFTISTKNASSSGYSGEIQFIALRRTGS